MVGGLIHAAVGSLCGFGSLGVHAKAFYTATDLADHAGIFNAQSITSNR